MPGPAGPAGPAACATMPARAPIPAMPLSVRPFQPSDAAPLLSRFAPDARAPWLRLPYPYAVEDLVRRHDGLTVLVAETGPERVVGLAAIDARGAAGPPCMVG